MIFLVHDRQGGNTALLHELPGDADRDVIRGAFDLVDHHILDLRADVRHVLRLVNAEIIERKFRLFIDLSGSAGMISCRIIRLVLQVSERNCGANGIRIRILVTDYKDSF